MNWQNASNEELNEIYLRTQRQISASGAPKLVGNYEIIRKIGAGSFSTVYLAKHTITGYRVVLKATLKTQPNLAGEITHLRTFKHSHIPKLYEIIVYPDTVWLVMEYCEGEELYEHLVRNGRFNVPEARLVLAQLSGAVSYAHSRQCAHRDLKLENVFLDGDLNIKLGDFGFTRSYGSRPMLETVCGTEPYMAPELLLHKRYNPEASDVWSLGVMFYAILLGQLPFDEESESETRNKIINCEPAYPEDLPSDLCDLIKQMLRKDPKARPKATDLLRHPALAEYGDAQLALITKTQAPLFSTRTERRLLKAMKGLGMDVRQVARSVETTACDPLYGVWLTALDREIEKERQAAGLSRQKSESRSLRSVARVARAIVTPASPRRPSTMSTKSLSRTLSRRTTASIGAPAGGTSAVASGPLNQQNNIFGQSPRSRTPSLHAANDAPSSVPASRPSPTLREDLFSDGGPRLSTHAEVPDAENNSSIWGGSRKTPSSTNIAHAIGDKRTRFTRFLRSLKPNSDRRYEAGTIRPRQSIEPTNASMSSLAMSVPTSVPASMPTSVPDSAPASLEPSTPPFNSDTDLVGQPLVSDGDGLPEHEPGHQNPNHESGHESGLESGHDAAQESEPGNGLKRKPRPLSQTSQISHLSQLSQLSALSQLSITSRDLVDKTQRRSSSGSILLLEKTPEPAEDSKFLAKRHPSPMFKRDKRRLFQQPVVTLEEDEEA